MSLKSLSSYRLDYIISKAKVDNFENNLLSTSIVCGIIGFLYGRPFYNSGLQTESSFEKIDNKMTLSLYNALYGAVIGIYLTCGIHLANISDLNTLQAIIKNFEQTPNL